MRGLLQLRGADSWRLQVFLGRSPDRKQRYLERTVRGTRMSEFATRAVPGATPPFPDLHP